MGGFVLTEINAVFTEELIGHPVHDSGIEIIAPQAIVTGRGQYFKHPVGDFHEGYVEGTASQVKDQDFLFFFFVDTICQSGSGGLVDDTEHFQTCDFTRIFGSLSLRVGKISGNGDNGLGYRRAQIIFRIAFQFLQNHSGNFLGSIALAVNIHFTVGTHISLNGRNSAFGVDDRLSFGNLPHHSFTCFGKTHDRGSGPRPFGVRNNHGLASFKHSDTGVSGAKVNTNDFRHNIRLQKLYIIN